MTDTSGAMSVSGGEISDDAPVYATKPGASFNDCSAEQTSMVISL